MNREGISPGCRRLYSVAVDRPAARSVSWRRCISPSRASCIRSTSTASSDRFVITAAVCGRRSRPAKAAPPLKSTRTKLSSPALWWWAKLVTTALSNSDFPDPVAPMHSPCGPMPPLADSLMSRYTGDCPARPIGARRSPPGRSRREVSLRRVQRARHRAASSTSLRRSAVAKGRQPSTVQADSTFPSEWSSRPRVRAVSSAASSGSATTVQRAGAAACGAGDSTSAL